MYLARSSVLQQYSEEKICLSEGRKQEENLPVIWLVFFNSCSKTEAGDSSNLKISLGLEVALA